MLKGACMRGFDINDSRIKERMLSKNRLAFSFLTHMPIVLGHALVCPIRIVETCEELNTVVDLRFHIYFVSCQHPIPCWSLLS
jgi:hypothetical protein